VNPQDGEEKRVASRTNLHATAAQFEKRCDTKTDMRTVELVQGERGQWQPP
jgi:hypothetical protein